MYFIFYWIILWCDFINETKIFLDIIVLIKIGTSFQIFITLYIYSCFTSLANIFNAILNYRKLWAIFPLVPDHNMNTLCALINAEFSSHIYTCTYIINMHMYVHIYTHVFTIQLYIWARMRIRKREEKKRMSPIEEKSINFCFVDCYVRNR